MYSTAMVHQFEIKNTCIERLIMSHHNNVKMKLNLKVEKFGEIAVLTFCEISGNAPGFCLVLSGAYSKPYETPNMKCFVNVVNG